MSTLEYILRVLMVALSTCVRGVVFLLHRLVSGTSSITYPHVQSWCRNVLALSGVRVRAEGAENLDPGASYIYVANHASLFDIPALQVALPGSVRIMYKKELQKIPFMGWALRYSSFIPIVREKARDAMNTVKSSNAALLSWHCSPGNLWCPLPFAAASMYCPNTHCGFVRVKLWCAWERLLFPKIARIHAKKRLH
jgi:1-acyl-sn-glycerol-3-phosphate acyltransferase